MKRTIKAEQRQSTGVSRRTAVGGALTGLLVPSSERSARSRSIESLLLQSVANVQPQAVVTTHYDATAAGVEILRAGGSAADAAVAIAAALSVVEPYFSHALGGGTWGLYYDAESGSVTALDGVGPTGSLFTVEDYATRVDQSGIHQANVPGSWDGWMLWLLEFGRLTLPEILAPAITLAETGIDVSAEMSSYMSRSYDDMSAHGPTATVYAPNGAFPGAGEQMRYPDLASTFSALAEAYAAAGDHATGVQAARNYYYRGPLAEAIVAESESGGGYLTLDDFAAFSAEIVEPISISYGSTMRVYQNPPNSQGITMLLALNILKNFSHEGLSALDADTIHSQVEATKLAFGDRNAFIGDPAVVDIDVERLLSDEYAATQFARIDMNRAMQWPENAAVTDFEPQDTTTFQVSDQWGNVAVVTTSIGLNFHVVGTTGIHINNRMLFTSLDPNDPNVGVPGRKLRHTSCPYLVMRDDRPFIAGGNTGADSQPQVQLQQLMSAIDFGMSAQQAIAQPRWISRAWVPSTYPHQVANTLQLEPAHPQSLVDELANRGHVIEIGTINLGNGGMIKFGSDASTAEVGAEPRFSTASGQLVD